MATWGELVEQLNAILDPNAKILWLNAQMQAQLATISSLRDDCNVVLYGSGFLQKPQAPGWTIQMSLEDLNGFMSVIHNMDWSKGLTVILHTPGGQAPDPLVSYLRSKFPSIETIVPTFAMSAGTMFSLSSERIIMGRQSQLGPIDPQMPFGGRFISARAVVDQFDQAKTEIVGDPATGTPGDLQLGHVWAPILGTIGPGFLQEAQNQLAYSERMVANWLARYMFASHGPDAAKTMGEDVAKFFNDAGTHLDHGRRIDRDEARRNAVVVEDLEDDQPLQEAVLTLYHLMTLVFENTNATKTVEGTSGTRWIKQWMQPMMVPGVPGFPGMSGMSGL